MKIQGGEHVRHQVYDGANRIMRKNLADAIKAAEAGEEESLRYTTGAFARVQIKDIQPGETQEAAKQLSDLEGALRYQLAKHNVDIPRLERPVYKALLATFETAKLKWASTFFSGAKVVDWDNIPYSAFGKYLNTVKKLGAADRRGHRPTVTINGFVEELAKEMPKVNDGGNGGSGKKPDLLSRVRAMMSSIGARFHMTALPEQKPVVMDMTAINQEPSVLALSSAANYAGFGITLTPMTISSLGVFA